MMPHPERASEPLMGSSDGLVVLRSIVSALAPATVSATF
jgi:phosphoribosylformylglycinamidine (FGAM) synthase-like amidotransferase family enzyme